MNSQRPWICAQLGGREHYAIPRALHAAGALSLLLTDYWAGPGTRWLARALPVQTARALAARRHSGLPPRRVRSWNLRALAWEAGLREMTRKGGAAGRYLGYCEVGQRFARAVVRHLRANPPPAGGIFFGYDTASLEAMEFLKERGAFCVLDQIDPGRVEKDLVCAEQRAWPGWEEPLEIPEEFFERHAREWAVADCVVVNSEWSRQALLRQGVPAKKLAVVPLCHELGNEPGQLVSGRQPPDGRPLRVLFLGQVMLRKGVQYLMEAARLLRGSPVVFDVVGPIQISARAAASAPPNMVFHGRAARDQAGGWYRGADVFTLPTLSDGFGLTQLEAMARGLPVIATPNCGAVVSDGVDGFVVPPRDPRALAQAVRSYLENPGRLREHGEAARVKAGQFPLARLASRLLELADA